MKRRKVLGFLAVMLLIGSTVFAGGKAEAPASKATQDPNAPISISISWWGGDSRHDATLKAIEVFEAKYPHIKVNPQYGAWGGWLDRLAVQLAGGSAPDVMQINWNWIYQFSRDGNGFTDLNAYSDIIDLTQYTPGLLEAMSINGKLQGIPVSTTGKVFYWNKSTFDKAGIPVPSTFADMINAGKVFKEKLGADYYPMALTPYEQMLVMVYYLQQKYAKPWIEDYKVNFSVAEVSEGISFIRNLEDAHVMPSQKQLAGDGADTMDKNPNWMNGKYAGFYEWDSAQGRFASALNPGQEFVKGEFPYDFGPTKVATARISMALAVSANSKHPKEAAQLIEFLLNDPEAVKVMGLERGVVDNKNAASILLEAGMLNGLTYESNVEVMKNYNFAVDPYFEDAKLKDKTGLYFEIFEDLSYENINHTRLAERLIDGINKVQASNK